MTQLAVPMDLDRPRWRLVEQRANELTEIYSAPPIPVLEIAEEQGVDVVFAHFGSNGDKVAGFCDFKGAKLYVNAADGVQRQNFTIAHELGHWVLHKTFFEKSPENYSILPRFQKGVSNSFEKEANSFAANLLVPKVLVSPLRHLPIDVLAKVFAVSRTMMEHRLKNV